MNLNRGLRTGYTLDKIAELVATDKQKEIEELKAEIKCNSREGCALAAKYTELIFSEAHDLYDFLMAL